MSIIWVLVIVLIVLALVGQPGFGYHQMGWYPSGGIGLVLVILLVLLLVGRI